MKSLSECALVAWEHKAIMAIATLLLGSNVELPKCWPEDRFDMVWDFAPDGKHWRMTRRPLLLLADDRAEPIE